MKDRWWRIILQGSSVTQWGGEAKPSSGGMILIVILIVIVIVMPSELNVSPAPSLFGIDFFFFWGIKACYCFQLLNLLTLCLKDCSCDLSVSVPSWDILRCCLDRSLMTFFGLISYCSFKVYSLNEPIFNFGHKYSRSFFFFPNSPQWIVLDCVVSWVLSSYILLLLLTGFSECGFQLALALV